MLSHLKSASIARRESVNFIYSRKSGYVLQKLLDKNYISSYSLSFIGNKGKIWNVGLKYDALGRTFMKSLVFYSKPGRRFVLSNIAVQKLAKESDYLFIGPQGAFWLEDLKNRKIGAELLVKIN